MSDIEIVVVILGMTLVTVATRTLLMLTGRYWTPSNSSLSALRYAPAAGLAALIVPDIVQAVTHAVGQSALAATGRVELAAILASIATFFISRHSGFTLVAGVTVYLVGSS